MAKELKIVLSIDNANALQNALSVKSALGEIGLQARTAAGGAAEIAPALPGAAAAAKVQSPAEALAALGADARAAAAKATRIEPALPGTGTAAKTATATAALAEIGRQAGAAAAEAQKIEPAMPGTSAARRIDRATAALARLGRQARSTGGSMLAAIGGSLAAIGSQGGAMLGKIGSGLAGLAAKGAHKFMALAKLQLLALGAAAGVAGYKLATLGAKLEQTRMQFRVMLGGLAAGDRVLDMLNEFANVTPFSNDEVVSAGRTLLAYGMPVAKLQQQVRMLGDVSAGTGKNFTELAAIVGKVFAKGKMDTEAMNMMLDAGIPIIQALSEQFGVSGAAIYKMAERGELTAEVVEQAFARMTGAGGRYHNMMGSLAGTLGGAWSTFTGKLNYAVALLGEQLSPLLKTAVDYVTSLTDKVIAMTRSGELVGYIVDIGSTLIKVGAVAARIAIWAGGLVTGTVMAIAKMVIAIAQGVAGSLGGIIIGIVDVALGGVNAIIRLVNKLGGDLEEIKPQWLEDARKEQAEMMADAGRNVKSALTFEDGRKIWAQTATVDTVSDKLLGSLNKFYGNFDRKMNDPAYADADARQTAGAAQTVQLDPASLAAIKPEDTKTDSLAKAQPEAVKTDSLSRVGLYSAGSPVNVSLDRTRNRLLQAILGAVGELQPVENMI